MWAFNIEDKRARLAEGQSVVGWREALNELDTPTQAAYDMAS